MTTSARYSYGSIPREKTSSLLQKVARNLFDAIAPFVSAFLLSSKSPKVCEERSKLFQFVAMSDNEDMNEPQLDEQEKPEGEDDDDVRLMIDLYYVELVKENPFRS